MQSLPLQVLLLLMLVAAATKLPTTTCSSLTAQLLLCRPGGSRGQVLWQLSIPLHEWPAALGPCVLPVQGVRVFAGSDRGHCCPPASF